MKLAGLAIVVGTIMFAAGLAGARRGTLQRKNWC